VNAPQTAAEEQALLTSIRRGRPFGGERWQRRTASRPGLSHTFRDRGRPPIGRKGEPAVAKPRDKRRRA
jgi:putative transposase